MKATKVNFGTTQELLYMAGLSGWDLCSQYLPQFSKLTKSYTPQVIDDARAAVQEAQALPDIEQRTAPRKSARAILLQASALILDNWQLLKLYIQKAYPENLVDIMLEDAGSTLYKKASDDNWSAVRSLVSRANDFIEANIDTLTGDDKMPADFQGTFKTDGDAGLKLYDASANANISRYMGTDAKAKANAAIYKTLMRMLKDGQRIFKKDEDTKKFFTFSFLVSLHSGKGAASLTGQIINENGLPVQGAIVATKTGAYTAITDVKGRYRISRMEARVYGITVSCPGYSPMDQVVTVSAGTTSRANFEMKNLMKKVA